MFFLLNVEKQISPLGRAKETTFGNLGTLNLQLVMIFTLKFWEDVLEQVN